MTDWSILKNNYKGEVKSDMNCDIDKKKLILEKAKDTIITESYSSLSISKLTSELIYLKEVSILTFLQKTRC